MSDKGQSVLTKRRNKVKPKIEEKDNNFIWLLKVVEQFLRCMQLHIFF